MIIECYENSFCCIEVDNSYFCIFSEFFWIFCKKVANSNFIKTSFSSLYSDFYCFHFLKLLFKNFVPDIYSDYHYRYISDFVSIFPDGLSHRISEKIPKSYEYSTPECCPEKSDRDKWNDLHPKYPGRDRNQMAYNREKSSYKGIESIIF